MSVHPHANAFDSSATEYERGRPGYPPSLFEWIGSRGHFAPGRTVIDLGAGTGKLTRLLVEGAARVIAVEPIEAMREQFKRLLPETELLDATAESIPLPDESIDMVACGQSFRWFANDIAIAEIARVLRDRGELIIASNSSDESSPLQRRLEEMLVEVNSVSDERKPGAKWRNILLASPHFELVDEVELANEQVTDRAGIAARLHSSSQFSRLPLERQEELVDELASMSTGDVIQFNQFTTVLALKKLSID